MKVVHVSTLDTGGAANAAYRLHEGLLQDGIKSKFLVLHNEEPSRKVVLFKTPVSDYFFFFLRKIKRKIMSVQKEALKEMSNEIEIFSIPLTIYDISEHPLVKGADIIHLHWVANFIDYPSFFAKCSKVLVWTFHDENPINGGIHYSDDRFKLSPALTQLEDHFAKIKGEALQKKGTIWPICPTPWLLQKVHESSLRRLFEKAVCIPYGIDNTQFKFIDRQVAREMLGLPGQKQLILLICSNLNVHRKGFDLFCEMSKRIKIEDNVEFVLAGEINKLPTLQFVRYVGKVSNISNLSLLYNAVDATLIPSREDNLPNVMIESLTCGTPVLGFRIGGIADVIEDKVNGLLSSEVSSDALYKVVKEFLSLQESNRLAIRTKATADFDKKKQVERVTQLYRIALSRAKL